MEQHKTFEIRKKKKTETIIALSVRYNYSRLFLVCVFAFFFFFILYHRNCQAKQYNNGRWSCRRVCVSFGRVAV